jgi:hypothetical protein
MKRMNFPETVKVRQEAANQRKEERAKRTPQQQLEQLDKLFGEGQGAARERARLVKELK